MRQFGQTRRSSQGALGHEDGHENQVGLSSPPFFARYGISRTRDRQAPLRVAPHAEVCRWGVLRSTVAAAAVDMLGSVFAREIAGSDGLFTTDLSVRAPARMAPKRLLARGELLRRGRSVIANEVFLEADGEPFAYGQTCLRRVARAQGAAPPGELSRLMLPEVIDRVPLERPLEQEAGVVVAEASCGRVELPLREALLTTGGVLQGALVAPVVEEAALALAEHPDAGPHVVTEVDLRYLAAGRKGPIVSQADWVSDRESEMVRVALRDAGQDDRLTTAALVRVSPAPIHDNAERNE